MQKDVEKTVYIDKNHSNSKDIKLGIFNFSTKRINTTGRKFIKKALFPSAFDSDMLKVSSSAAFRRLQDKTQLFPLEANDYARTRLTHTCEVAAIGKSIAFLVGRQIKEKDQSKIIGVLSNVVGICCFLHDIGNPPFGHYGEDVIRKYFKSNWQNLKFNNNGNFVKLSDLIEENSQEYFDFVNFDGNAQALRVVTKLEKFADKNDGFNLTSAVLGGLIKYPLSSAECSQKKKFGYFKSEEDIINFLKQQNDFFEYKIHPAALIMEAADDIAMFVSDVEDSIKKGKLCVNDFINYRVLNRKKGIKSPCVLFKEELTKEYKENRKKFKNENIDLNSIKPILYRVRSELITQVGQCFYKYCEDIINGRARFQRLPHKDDYVSLISLTENYPIVKMCRDLLKEKVYSSRNIILPELKGDVILTNILSHYSEAILSLSESEIRSIKSNQQNFKYFRLISKNFLRTYIDTIDKLKSEGNYTPSIDAYYRLRLVVDDISGMTDSFALSLSRELTI